MSSEKCYSKMLTLKKLKFEVLQVKLKKKRTSNRFITIIFILHKYFLNNRNWVSITKLPLSLLQKPSLNNNFIRGTKSVRGGNKTWRLTFQITQSRARTVALFPATTPGVPEREEDEFNINAGSQRWLYIGIFRLGFMLRPRPNGQLPAHFQFGLVTECLNTVNFAGYTKKNVCW